MARLQVEASALADTEALARLLLSAESVASSKIEGLEVGARRLLRAEAARQLGEQARDVTAEEVLGNIAAMSLALEGAADAPIAPARVLAVHRALLSGTPLEGDGRSWRSVQNWVGGSSFNPCSAEFVPPPPEDVSALIDDLCAFCETDPLPPFRRPPSRTRSSRRYIRSSTATAGPVAR